MKSTKIIKTLLLSSLFITSTAITSQAGPTSEESTNPGLNQPLAISYEQITFRPAAGRLQETVVKTQNYEIRFQNKGAFITSFRHLDPEHKLKDRVELADKGPIPMRIYSSAANRKKADETFFHLNVSEEGDFLILTATAPMEAVSNSKRARLTLTKRFRFHKTLHYWMYDWEVSNPGREAVTLSQLYFVPFSHITGPHPEFMNSRWEQGYYNFYFAGDSFETVRGASGGGFLSCGSGQNQSTKTVNQPVEYYGNSSRFMVHAVQPLQTNRGAYVFYKPSEKENELHEILAPLTVAPGKSAKLSFLMFSGPKIKENLEPPIEIQNSYPELKKIHPQLYKAFDFGITAPIRDLIVALLQFLYKFIPNYGIGIILFAFLFKLAFYWLNQKQADSMKRMQKIQPLIKEINEKYKDNPQAKQKKLMEVYKQHKVNPVGGCLPMLLQLPIFIALYSAFSDSYELWKSPFIMGWIPDLSEPDTVYVFKETLPLIGGFHMNVLPIFMTLTQFFQSKMTMVSGDSQQQKVMQFMPLIMLVFFWNMPSGVVLYWTVQNLLSILQQWITDIRDDSEEDKK